MELYIGVNPTNTTTLQKCLDVNILIISVSSILFVDLFDHQSPQHSTHYSTLIWFLASYGVLKIHVTTIPQSRIPKFIRFPRVESNHIIHTKSHISTSCCTRFVNFTILRIPNFSYIPFVCSQESHRHPIMLWFIS
jgi:hypothetical protein